MQGEFEFFRGAPLRPKRPERLFIAFLPDLETALRVERFRRSFIRENRLDGTCLETARLHVSLHHVGDYERLQTKYIYAARQAAKSVSMGPFEICFDHITTFGSRPSIYGKPRKLALVLLGEGDGLLAFHGVLGAALEKNGLKAAKHFVAHMTLLYGSTPVPLQAIEPIRFIATEFTLIHSERGLSRYTIIDRWPLEG